MDPSKLHDGRVHGKYPDIDSFIPQFLKWTLPTLYLLMSIVVSRVFFLLKLNNRLANSEDPDETALL